MVGDHTVFALVADVSGRRINGLEVSGRNPELFTWKVSSKVDAFSIEDLFSVLNPATILEFVLARYGLEVIFLTYGIQPPP